VVEKMHRRLMPSTEVIGKRPMALGFPKVHAQGPAKKSLNSFGRDHNVLGGNQAVILTVVGFDLLGFHAAYDHIIDTLSIGISIGDRKSRPEGDASTTGVAPH